MWIPCFVLFLILVPSGPPFGVVIESRSEKELNITWDPPERKFWNGKLTGYQVCYCYGKSCKDWKCALVKTPAESYSISQLESATKYSVTVAAGTKIGYGNKSSEVSKITNGGTGT